MCAWDVGDVEHRCAQEADDLVVSGFVFNHHGVLGDEVVVRHFYGFGQPGCTAGKESRCRCALAACFVVPSYPVAFAMAREVSPALAAPPLVLFK